MRLSPVSAINSPNAAKTELMTASENTGLLLEIQRMSTEDGPGLRTTVFMKGCPMRCLWCHNPESISPKPQAHWIGVRCIGCQSCIEVCPKAALSMETTGLMIDRSICDGCGLCADACPSTALEMLGTTWDVETLAKELLKDNVYFQKSTGGVTISGGEATLQYNFVSSLLRILKDEGIHTCIDTCGIVRQDALAALLPFTDIVLYDLKEIDPQRHQAFTNQNLSKVLSTLGTITEYIKTHPNPTEIWVRTPIIPGKTDNEENIRGIGAFISEYYDGIVTRWDLLAFNNLCKDKYKRLDLEWQFEDTALMTTDAMEKLAETARLSGVDPQIVHWSGTTRLD